MRADGASLIVQDVTVRADGATILDHVSFEVGHHSTLAVLGPSGSGKSTLLRVIAGLITPAAGSVHLAGDDLRDVPAHMRGIGYLFQDHALFPHLDVTGNLEFGMRMRRDSKPARSRRVEALLRLVGLESFGDRAIATLSGGERQRVALARALAVEPHLLLLDEPFSSLDRVRRDELVQEVSRILTETPVPTIVVTHDHDEAFALGDAVVVLNHGRVEAAGAPIDVWRAPATQWTAEFLGYAALGDAPTTGRTVRLPWATFECPTPWLGSNASIVFRPDALSVDPDGPIRAVAMSIHVDRARVAIEGGPTLLARAEGTLPGGSQVRLSINPDAVLRYPAGAGSGTGARG